jgi:uncharacterized DUF497 family protein
MCAYTFSVAFQWDTKKAQSNAKKHGVAFSDSVGVFEDPRASERTILRENDDAKGI